MADLIFDVSAFRTRFAAFVNETVYPTATLQEYWNASTGYISASNYGNLVNDARQSALNLMTAHLVALSDIIATGGKAGNITGATIDKVDITLQAPPTKDLFQYWLSLTPYGLQLLGILKAAAAGGFYVGGRPELSAFRKVGGRFW